MLSLNDRKTINPRTVFTNETRFFTPWLVKDEIIKELSKVINLEIEVTSTEVTAKGKRVDVLGKTIFSKENVVIENQMKTSDNDHFSRLLQYGAIFNAEYHIWIYEKTIIRSAIKIGVNRGYVKWNVG